MGKDEFVARPLLELNMKNPQGFSVMCAEITTSLRFLSPRIAGSRGEGRGKLLSAWHLKSVGIVAGPNGDSYGKQDHAEGCVQKLSKQKVDRAFLYILL